MKRYWDWIARQGKTLTHDTDALLSFEWVLLVTLLTIGIVGGITAARDAIIDEMGDVAEAAQGFDQSYSLAAVTVLATDNVTVIFTSAASSFEEIVGIDDVVEDCGRTDTGGPDQGPEEDGAS